MNSSDLALQSSRVALAAAKWTAPARSAGESVQDCSVGSVSAKRSAKESWNFRSAGWEFRLSAKRLHGQTVRWQLKW